MNDMATCSTIESLPYDCVSEILSRTSPLEACRFSLVSTSLGSCADSDTVWRAFLPSDYEDIVSRAVNPFTLHFSSHKQLFHALCHPLLIDHGNKSFKLDKCWGKQCYIISARELSIARGSDPMIWSWRPNPESRFGEAAELRRVNWLEIEGKMRRRNLTRNTSYGAYLIMKVCDGAYGLDSAPSEVSISVGNKVQHRGKAYLGDRTFQVPSKREDGWMEIEMGEFFSGEGDEEIIMSLREVGYQLKGGLILEGIQVRPKTSYSAKC
uniref:F-box protein PP2-B15 n=1 Tax=Cajanus cajan TaxID=3821 RepID=A0A151TVW0_CAJCA|nr:F-box protein PP2-B15 [Cajanus cajan]